MRCTFTSTKDVIFMSVEQHSPEDEYFPGDHHSRVFEERLGSFLTEAYAPLGPGAEVAVCPLVHTDLLTHPSPQYLLPLHDLADYWYAVRRNTDMYKVLEDKLRYLLEEPVHLDRQKRCAELKDFSAGKDISNEAWYAYLRRLTSSKDNFPIIPSSELKKDDAYRCIVAVRSLAIIGHTLCDYVIVNFFSGAPYYAKQHLKNLLQELCPDKEIIYNCA